MIDALQRAGYSRLIMQRAMRMLPLGLIVLVLPGLPGASAD